MDANRLLKPAISTIRQAIRFHTHATTSSVLQIKNRNPSNNSCLWQEGGDFLRDVSIKATLNISTSFDVSILSLISSTTHTAFEDVDGVARSDTIGVNGLFIPPGKLGYTMLVPNVACVEGTLEGCSGGINGPTLAVQACSAITYGLISRTVYNVSGYLAMVTTPNENLRVFGDAPVQSLVGMTATSPPACTKTSSASHLTARWAVGLVSICGFVTFM
jgi:hypothetical protein